MIDSLIFGFRYKLELAINKTPIWFRSHVLRRDLMLSVFCGGTEEDATRVFEKAKVPPYAIVVTSSADDFISGIKYRAVWFSLTKKKIDHEEFGNHGYKFIEFSEFKR